MKLYKVISCDLQSQNGGEFDWSEYLPDNDGNSQWTPEVEVNMCDSGYHVTEYWNMWYSESSRIFEVEVRDHFKYNNVGVCTKHVYPSIRLVKEIFPDFDKNLNTGHDNTGYRNTGDRNTGDRNTGHYNTGHYNTGHDNTGYRNTGDRNTGDYNTGHYNTGYYNTGYRNTGYRNTGDCNTGHYNTGDRNTGNWNACECETGFFNVSQPKTIRVFEKECDLEVWNLAEKPSFLYFDLVEGKTYKECFQEAYNKAPKEEKEMLKSLPNFDADIFYEISGIRVDE
jgi:hypothetical protein